MNNVPKAPWRMIVGAVSILLIGYMWAQKDIAGLYASMPREQVLPLMVTTVAVIVGKVAILAAGVRLIKWLIGKLKT